MKGLYTWVGQSSEKVGNHYPSWAWQSKEKPWLLELRDACNGKRGPRKWPTALSKGNQVPANQRPWEGGSREKYPNPSPLLPSISCQGFPLVELEARGQVTWPMLPMMVCLPGTEQNRKGLWRDKWNQWDSQGEGSTEKLLKRARKEYQNNF